jgi:hypothetical protein
MDEMRPFTAVHANLRFEPLPQQLCRPGHWISKEGNMGLCSNYNSLSMEACLKLILHYHSPFHPAFCNLSKDLRECLSSLKSNRTSGSSHISCNNDQNLSSEKQCVSFVKNIKKIRTFDQKKPTSTTRTNTLLGSFLCEPSSSARPMDSNFRRDFTAQPSDSFQISGAYTGEMLA